jgi:hypothetical protein
VSIAALMLREAGLAFTSGAGIALLDAEPIECAPESDVDTPGQSYGCVPVGFWPMP